LNIRQRARATGHVLLNLLPYKNLLGGRRCAGDNASKIAQLKFTPKSKWFDVAEANSPQCSAAGVIFA